MLIDTPNDAIPWVGLYVAVASLLCTLAMAADAFQAFRQWKLRFPCRFFTINAASMTMIAIAMKPPVDLSNQTHKFADSKFISIVFLVTTLANFLPSLGLMDDKELVVNVIALGILLITVTVNVCIQTLANEPSMDLLALVFMIFSLPWSFSLALTISASKRILEHRYKELYRLASNSQEVSFSFKELVHHVKRYWMMAETGNPQFVIACSPISSASGVICALSVFISILYWTIEQGSKDGFYVKSDYKWSLQVIVIVQLIGVVVGSIAPIFRCLTAVSYFNLSKRWSANYLNMLRVERYWTQRLQQWKRNQVRSYIPGRQCKMVFHILKNMILNVCITLQITVVVICKTICLIPRCLLILFSCCFYLCDSLLKRFKKKPNESSNDVRLETEEYTNYVLQVEEEAKLSKRQLRNALDTINRILQDFEKKEPRNLMKLLEKSIGFRGVAEFENNQVPPLHPEETHNCWSLVIVTLTTIALAFPNISNRHVTELVASISEGLQYVRHIEEILNANDDLLNSRKAARRVWTEVEVYHMWLQIDLLKRTDHKGKTSKEILQWLGDEAVKIVIKFKRWKKGSLSHSFYNFIAASSMYRISQSILLHYNEQENWPEDEDVFEWISTMIADKLLACLLITRHNHEVPSREYK